MLHVGMCRIAMYYRAFVGDTEGLLAVGTAAAVDGAVQGTEQQPASEPPSPVPADATEGAKVSAGTLEVAAADASPAGSNSGSDLQQLLADAGDSLGEVAEVAVLPDGVSPC